MLENNRIDQSEIKNSTSNIMTTYTHTDLESIPKDAELTGGYYNLEAYIMLFSGSCMTGSLSCIKRRLKDAGYTLRYNLDIAGRPFFKATKLEDIPLDLTINT